MAEAARLTHGRAAHAPSIVLSNATIPLLGAVNTGVIGQLALAAPDRGAVGIGAVIPAMLTGPFGFLRGRGPGLAAQAQGRAIWPSVPRSCSAR